MSNDPGFLAVTDLLDRGSPQRVSYRVVVVESRRKEDVGRAVALRHGKITIGTSDNCDFRVFDTAVSRRHVEFEKRDDGVLVTDLGSTNGAYHLGVRVGHAVVSEGARITIGATVLELQRETNQGDLPPADTTAYGELIGESLAMRKLFALLMKLESSDAPVLITAETGTGKELVARALHSHGKRKAGPLVVFDCAAVPPELIESELFGHARGSFSGAINERAGLFEEANGGTLFIDEIGELPLGLQTRLLRVLESGEVKRIGENQFRKVDARVIAATHRDLETSCLLGTFRHDLYYRLAVVVLGIPPLAQRREDIPRLAEHFAKEFGLPMALAPATLSRLMQREWPGNVRELRNSIHRLVALGEQSLEPPHATDAIDVDLSLPYKDAREQSLDAFEAAYVRAALKRHSGHVTLAAAGAGISRKYMHELMRKHGIDSDS